MKNAGRFLLITLAGAGFAPATGRAEDASPPALSDVSVTVRERTEFEVEGRFRVAVSSATAWAALADYGRIGEFVPAVRQSRVLERSGGEVLVEQRAVGSALFFSRRVSLRLKIREAPPGLIVFEDVAGEDFDVYAGEWRLEGYPGGTEVLYRLRVEPRFHVPAFLARGGFKRSARDLLRQVRGEMLRRGG